MSTLKVNNITPLSGNTVIISGSLVSAPGSSLSGSFTGSLHGTASYAIYALNGESTNTGSFLITASAVSNEVTFTKGDSTTFTITIDTGSAVDTGSLLVTASVSSNTITFTKGDATTFDITVDTGSATPVDVSSFATTGSNTFIGNQTISGSISFGDGSLIQSVSESAGDGSGLSTLELNPDASLGSEQYIVLDPTAPNHIHIRAGGTIDNSSSDLFLGGEKTHVSVSDGSDTIIIKSERVVTVNSYNFSPGSGYSTSEWSTDEFGNHRIVINDPTTDVYDATWASGAPSIFAATAGGNYYELEIIGTSTPGWPAAVTITVTQAPPTDPIAVDQLYFEINQNRNTEIEASSDVNITASDDLRLYAYDRFRLLNYAIDKAIEITTNYDNNDKTWYFNPDGTLDTPGNVDINGSLEQGSGVIATGSYSHAEGNITQAIGDYSHAEGDNTQAIGNYSHAEGQETIALGQYSHAEGYNTDAIGLASHAEGYQTQAIGTYSHAEGGGTKTGTQNAYYAQSVVSGAVTLSGSYGDVSSQFGADNRLYLYDLPFDDYYGRATFIISQSYYSGSTNTIVELYDTSVNTGTAYVGNISINIFDWTGDQTIPGDYAHTEGSVTVALGLYSHAEGHFSKAIGRRSHAEGQETIALGQYSHAEGYNTDAIGLASHAEGDLTQAIGQASHAEGYQTVASGSYSHAEGNITQAIGDYSHAEGDGTQAIGGASHAEGYQTIASGSYSHAEGRIAYAQGDYSHAEGEGSMAMANYSHAEGSSTETLGQYSHAEGHITITLGEYSHAEGIRTIASGSGQHVSGQYNQHNNTGSLFVVGIGLNNDNRKDGFTVDVDANGRGSVMIPNNIDAPSVAKTGSMYVDPANNKLWIYTGNGGVGGWVTASLG